MSLILKTLLAFCIGWGALYVVQHYWQAAVTRPIAETSGSPSWARELPAFSVEPGDMRQVVAQQPTIDTQAGRRAAIESLAARIDQQNRAALSKVPLPPSIPGLPRH